MSNPNEHTGWASQDGPGEAALDVKDPIAEHDPNTGTRWGDPVDRSKPRPRVPREIDRYLIEPVWTCPECKFEALSDEKRKLHLTPGEDGMTPCARDKARFKPVKDCTTCGGTGRGAGQCPSCSGSGEGKSEVKCRGCSGKGVLREGGATCNVCNGSGSRSYCIECSGSGEIAHCGTCRGSGKVAAEAPAPAAPAAPAAAIDTDALAAKITQGISQTLNEGFAMLAGVLSGKAPKAKKKEKAPRGSSARVHRGAPARGSEPVRPVGQSDGPVENPSSESPKAE